MAMVQIDCNAIGILETHNWKKTWHVKKADEYDLWALLLEEIIRRMEVNITW